MASLSNPRTIFAFTSPRTIEKIIPEIQILIDTLDGRVWNESTQAEFFDELFHSEFYEGDSLPKDIPFAARDRITRAPKALGFVDLKPTVSLTEAGVRLLSGHRTNEIFAKQLFKFQLPSPYHTIPSDSQMNIRPYLELLRLINEIGELSKKEIAIFFVPLIHFEDFKTVVKEIKDFRKRAATVTTNRKTWIQDFFDKKLQEVYAEELQKGNYFTREGGAKTLAHFIATKRGVHGDYADALLRYLRSTQLITFDKKSFRAIIAPSQQDAVNYILQTVERSVWDFSGDEAGFKAYMFNPDEIQLLTDDRNYLEQQLNRLATAFPANADIETLKDLLENAQLNRIDEVIVEAKTSLSKFQEYDDVVDVFSKIVNKEVPDAPLYLEWNVWRSMVMLNYVRDIRGNFKFDFDGVPLSTAQGNKPDIEAEYDGFNMIVEVTMSTGQTQFNMEGESVARHFGNIQRNNSIPAYCIFIAPKISEGTLAHFFNLNKNNTVFYGGKTRIVPMMLDQFMAFIKLARDKDFKEPKLLKKYLDDIIAHNQTAIDEVVWFAHIGKSIENWIAA